MPQEAVGAAVEDGLILAGLHHHGEVLAECREEARRTIKEKPTNRAAAAVIVALWLSLAALAVFLMIRFI